ncbi:hypothetical protein CVT24_008766 [Panaeolus cyanescens]|uniref:Nucleoporin Nup159/Nup146 N-terminal domain-containing protein n=1 Tax=Panaeolus cyanescens TaxID=181874 RepID=A0A409VB27_9AGAR|nr:hypothetical protein CVT24_008766 [Panaeolus cyanescens]
MADYTPLSRPLQSQVSINSSPQIINEDGFNFPAFRLLEKNYRIHLSERWTIDPAIPYKLFATGNHKAWFAALRITNNSQCQLILSPLSDLRAACIDAKPDVTTLFTPKRLVPLPAKPNIITFAESDSRLIVAFEQGSIAVYDTAVLCSPGEGDVQPLYNNQVQTSPFRQILPNPGSEPGLSDLVAVVGDGKVHLWNTRLESQGGWAASDLMSQPIAAAWSPKGKHIAIGLQTGDILTFALNNKTTPNKHIPPTADAILVSLNWLGPGHTFKTSYAPTTTEQPKLHIVILDTKNSAVTYYAAEHPYAAQDRDSQSGGYTLAFPKWDEDPSTPGAEVALTVTGDISSTDFEVLGNIGTKWFRHAAETPLAIPMPANSEQFDNYMLAVESDLTDTANGMAIMYVYMDDGTIAGWHVEGAKPYSGVAGAGATTATTATTKDADMGAEQTSSAPAPSPFGATTTTTNAFGTPAFGQTSSPAAAPSTTAAPAFGQSSFGQTSGFGALASAPSAFGSTPTKPATGGFGAFSGGGFSGFGTTNTTGGAFGGNGSAFGNNNTTTTSTFGSNNTTTSAFGGGNNTTSAFGSTGFGSANNTTTSAFGSTGFGSSTSNTSSSAFGSQPSAFGGSTGAFGTSPSTTSTGAFGGFGSSTTTNVFGQPSFGASPQTSSSSTLAVPSTMTREASMSDDSGAVDSSGMGGLGLGSSTPNSTNAVNSMFGSFATPASPSKPAASSGSVFGGSSGGGFLKPATGFGAGLDQSSPFNLNKSTSAPTVSAFGAGALATPPTSTTGGSGFGQSGFATPAFGKSTFGAPSLGGAAAASPAFGSTGFGAFAGANTPFKPAAATTTTTPSSGGGFALFANAGTSGFTKAAETVAVKKEDAEKTTATTTPTKSLGFIGFASPTPAGFATFGVVKKEEGGEKKPEEIKKEEPKKPFTSVFATPSAAASSESQKDSVFRKPNERMSPPDSPSPAPAALPSAFGGAGATVKAGLASPSSSPSNSPFNKPLTSPPAAAATPSSSSSSPATTTAPATHAFSNLQTSPSPFKLGSGFGAFGNTTSSSSPFALKKPEDTPTKVTAIGFGTGAPSTTPSTSGFGTTGFGFGMGGAAAGAPAFGSTTPLGGSKVAVKPAFGTPSFPLVTPSPDSSKASATGLGPATPETPSKTSAPVSGGFGAFSGGASPFGQLKEGQKTSFAELLKMGGEEKPQVKVEEKEKEEEDQTVKVKVKEEPKDDEKSLASKDEGAKTDSEEATSGEKQEQKGKPLASTRDERSYASVLTSSVGSSFVDVSRAEAGSDEDGEGEERSATYSDEEPPEEEYDEEEVYTDEDEDYEGGVPGDEEYIPEEEEQEEEDDDDEEEFRYKRRRTPASVPLPSSRSPSSTPQPEVPSVEVSPSPREGSTTPPGTPARDKPAGSTTPSGLGLGRPSTRPVRSSPLANNTVSADEHKDEEVSQPLAKRARTPPSSAAFNISSPTPVAPGATTPPILKPATSFGSDSSGKSASAAPGVFSFAKPDAGGSIFGKSAFPSAAKSESGKPVSAFGAPVFGQPAEGTKSAPPMFGGIGLGAPPLGAATTSTSPPSTSPFGNLPPFSLKPGSTPPSLFGAPASIPTPPQPSTSAPPMTATATAGVGLFGAPPPIPNFGKPAQPPPMFGKPGAFSGAPAGQTMPVPGAGLFGKPSAIPSMPAFGAPATGVMMTGPAPAPNVSAPPTAVQAPMKSMMSTPPPPPLVREPGEQLEGMQKECADLVDSIEKDLHDLRLIGEVTLQKCAMLKIAKPPQSKGDVTAPEKWNFSSLTQFGDALKEFQDDLEYLEGQRSKHKASLKELQNNLLKAGTRKEEIARFNKAQNDPEFAKMLKARTLGPEHSETQMQLRKSIRVLRDRIHKLESHLQDSKKKLTASITGKPTFKAPSIDTINRTYRNIDSLIQQQTNEVNRLASRVSKIDVKDLPSSPRKSASSSDSRKGHQVTPDVAVTTAAALNAERSAHKLKKALLAVRKEPLLNKKVESAPAPPTAFNTPLKPGSAPGVFAFQTPIKGSLFGDPPVASDSDSLPEFKLPTDEDKFSPGTLSTSTGRRGAGGQRKHQSVPLKRTPGATPAPAASFDWGPLPTFNAPKPSGGLFVPITSPGSPSTPKK